MLTPGARSTPTAYKRAMRADPCSYCGTPAAHLDHIVPRVAQGSDEWWNLTAACATCNQAKGVISLLAFLLGVALPRPALSVTRGSTTVGEYGSAAITAAVYPLEGVQPQEKLYMLGFTETDDPEVLRRFACLSEGEANSTRARLRRYGWLREDGRLDLGAIKARSE